MARIRQQYPQNYGSSGNINTEFENVVRYLNSAELGNNTVGELMRVLFDENGEFIGPVELRRTSTQLEYRVGQYAKEDDGWVALASMDELRGRPGVDAGTVGAPVITGRVDYIATASQTVFAFAHDVDDDLLVYKNGLLQVKGTDYNASPSADTVTFVTGLTVSTKVSIFRVRAPLIAGYRRTDTTTITTQQVFPFEHNEDDKLQVYKNGVLLREGGSYDYTRQPLNSTITMNTPVTSGNTISIIFAENSAARTLTGLMLEEDYVHSDTGLIRLDVIKIDDGALAQAKVANLTSALAAKAKLSISSSSPSAPATGDLWLDTSVAPNQLKFYDGTQWLRTSPESSLPTFGSTDAGKFVKVNNTGTGLQYANVDLSSVIPVTARGAANGVASLDVTGRLPYSQLPLVLSSDSLYQFTGSPANSTYKITRVYRQKIRIDGIAIATTAGSCTIQIAIDGVGVGPTYAANAVGLNQVIASPIEIDASTAAKSIGYIVTGNASAANLDVTLATTIISS